MKRTLGKRFLTLFVAIIMLITSMATVAQAATAVTVYVDGIEISSADAYLDSNGNVRISDWSSFKRIFPSETSGKSSSNFSFPEYLEDWASNWGYDYARIGSNVYLTSWLTIESVEEENADVTVYVDGSKISSTGAYLDSSGEVRIPTWSGFKKIFPDETSGMSSSNFSFPVYLKDWASNWGYDYEKTGNKVYLTSWATIDTNARIYVNGTEISSTGAYLNSSGEVLVPNWNGFKKIFPNETSGMSSSRVGFPAYLEEWASDWGYDYRRVGNSVYLTNQGEYLLSTVYVVDDGSKIQVIYNGKAINFPDQQPVIKNGRTLIPVRALSEEMGFNVYWYGETQEVTISGWNQNGRWTEIVLKIGSQYYTVNSVVYTLDVPPEIMSNRTMVPIRFIAEAFGYDVDYKQTIKS